MPRLNAIRATKKLDNNTKSELKQQILFCSLFVSICYITTLSFNCISQKITFLYEVFEIKANSKSYPQKNRIRTFEKSDAQK